MSGNAKAGHSPAASSFFYLLALGLLCAFGPLCTDIYLPGLPAICNYYGIDTSTAQLSLTSCFLGLAFGQIVAGPISDALGRKKPMLISVAVFAVSSLLCATASSAIELIVWRFIQGFAGAGGLVISRSIACDSYQGEKLTRFMSLLMTINSVAPVAGPVIGSALITFFSWRFRIPRFFRDWIAGAGLFERPRISYVRETSGQNTVKLRQYVRRVQKFALHDLRLLAFVCNGRLLFLPCSLSICFSDHIRLQSA